MYQASKYSQIKFNIRTQLCWRRGCYISKSRMQSATRPLSICNHMWQEAGSNTRYTWRSMGVCPNSNEIRLCLPNFWLDIWSSSMQFIIWNAWTCFTRRHHPLVKSPDIYEAVMLKEQAFTELLDFVETFRGSGQPVSMFQVCQLYYHQLIEFNV